MKFLPSTVAVFASLALRGNHHPLHLAKGEEQTVTFAHDVAEKNHKKITNKNATRNVMMPPKATPTLKGRRLTSKEIHAMEQFPNDGGTMSSKKHHDVVGDAYDNGWEIMPDETSRAGTSPAVPDPIRIFDKDAGEQVKMIHKPLSVLPESVTAGNVGDVSSGDNVLSARQSSLDESRLVKRTPKIMNVSFSPDVQSERVPQSADEEQNQYHRAQDDAGLDLTSFNGSTPNQAEGGQDDDIMRSRHHDATAIQSPKQPLVSRPMSTTATYCSKIFEVLKMPLVDDHGTIYSVISVGMALLVVAAAIFTTFKSAKKTKDDGGTDESGSTLPPIGHDSISGFFTMISDPNAPEILLDMSRRMKSPAFRVPLPFSRDNLFIVHDHALARQILEHPQSSKWWATSRLFDDTTGGPSIVTAHGHRWKHVRKSTMAAFSNRNVKQMLKTIDVIMDRWIRETLEPAISRGDGLDILDEITKITANVIAEVAFDYHLTEDEHISFLHNLRTCWDEFATGGSFVRRIPYLRFLFPGMMQGKLSSIALHRHCKDMLQAYRTKVKAAAEDGTIARQPHKLIDMMINDAEYESEEEMIQDMIAYVIAGFDTTANTLSFALLELARHPQEQMKLRAALQKYDTEKDGRNCLELKYVIRETLRLRPPTALGSVRVLGDDINFAVKSEDDETTKAHDNLILPSGSAAFTCSYTIQRDAKVFDDPDKFLPSRWENPSEEMNKSIVVFSLGHRNCQGQALAYAESTEILLKLCRDYEIHLVNEGQATNMVLYKPIGTILSFTKAEKLS